MDLRNCRVAVTGGAGFIGSHLVDALVARGNQVLAIDDFSSGCRENLDQHKDSGQLTVAEADVRDYLAMEKLFSEVECVFHLATRNVRLSLRQPTVVHDVNTTGTLNVLKAAAHCRVKRFLYCSSSEVNGTADVVPMQEDYLFRPETIYGASKLAGEYYTQVFHRAGWLPAVIARPHNNYGPREHYEGYKAEVIPRFILQALSGTPPTIFGDGCQTRDFTYVTETAEYLIRLVECDLTLGETYNVCRGEEVSVREIATLVAELIGLDQAPNFLAARPSDVLRLFGSNEKLRARLGNAPVIGIREGLGRTIEWFKANVPLTDELLVGLAATNWSQTSAEPWLVALKKPGG